MREFWHKEGKSIHPLSHLPGDKKKIKKKKKENEGEGGKREKKGGREGAVIPMRLE